MQPELNLQTIAHFGKRDGASDYNWIFGRESIPSDLLMICEPLSRLSVSTYASISVVTEENDRVWLVRTYFQGTDNSRRPIAAIDVANSIESTHLSTEEWVRLAGVGMQQRDLEQVGKPGRFSMILPLPKVDPET